MTDMLIGTLIGFIVGLALGAASVADKSPTPPKAEAVSEEVYTSDMDGNVHHMHTLTPP